MNRLVTIASIAANRGVAGGPFGSSLGSKDYVLDGVPVIRGTNLGELKYVGGDFVYVTAEKVESELKRNTAVSGDVVFTQRGTLGQVALVPDSKYATYVISQSQMRLRVDSSIAISEYVYYACSGSEFKGQIEDNSISTGVPHVNLGILSRLDIPLPNIAEQSAIVELLGTLDAKIAVNAKLASGAEELAVGSMSHISARVELRTIAKLHRRTVSPDSMMEPFVEHHSLPAFDSGRLAVIEAPREIKSSKFRFDSPVVLLSKLNPRLPRVWNVDQMSEYPSLASTEFRVLFWRWRWFLL